MRERGAGGGGRTEEKAMPHAKTSEEEVRPDRGGSRAGRREGKAAEGWGCRGAAGWLVGGGSGEG